MFFSIKGNPQKAKEQPGKLNQTSDARWNLKKSNINP